MNKEIIERKTISITKAASVITIQNQEDNETATEYLKSIKGIMTQVNETFDPIIKANHKAWKTSIAQKKKYETPLKEAERIVKDKMRGFLLEQEKKRQELQKKVEVEAKEEGIDAPTLKEQKTEGQVTRENWKAVIIDKSKIPLQYLEPNMSMLNSLARKMKDKLDIPGVEVKKDIIVGIRS